MGLVLCWTVTAGAVAAQEEPLQAFRDGQSLALVPMNGSSARLELPSGRTLRLDLPDRAEVSTLALLDGGWLAAGSYPDATGGRRLFPRVQKVTLAGPSQVTLLLDGEGDFSIYTLTVISPARCRWRSA